MMEDQTSDKNDDEPRTEKLVEKSNQVVEWSSVDPLRKYYHSLFPWDDLYSWFCYGNPNNFRKREFSFSLVRYNIFVRNKSFSRLEDLIEYVQEDVPKKIDAGVYYNVRPDEDKTQAEKSSYEAVEKELIFDIDLSDYDDVRTCCSGTNICQKCWKFVAIACKILDVAFREDYGWKFILWVYSGRRGIHCWICDESARRMSSKQRRDFASILDLRTSIKQSYNRIIQLDEKRLNRHIRRSFALAKDAFLRVCVEEQDILGSEKGVETFLSMLPKPGRQEVKNLFRPDASGKLRWLNFHSYWRRKQESEIWIKRPHLIEEIILTYMYPRIDRSVTKGMNHLLKIPFAFHPTTKALSIPFDPKDVDNFDITNVPQLFTFVEALVTPVQEATDKSVFARAALQIQSYQRSLRIFKDFVKRLTTASTQR